MERQRDRVTHLSHIESQRQGRDREGRSTYNMVTVLNPLT